MARIAATAGLLTLTILLGSTTAHAQPAILEAGIMDGALVAGPAGKVVPLVHGGRARGLPVISPDGTRIAFIQATDKDIALSDVVVVALSGRELARAHVEPVSDGTAYAGMRYVEELRWISPERVVIRGSINPSTSQYYTMDAGTGAITDDFTDDSSRAAFSSDGRHVAMLENSPHFVPPDERSPVLLRDSKPVWAPEKGTTLVAGPQFSSDGSGLAWAGRNPSGHTTLDVRGADGLHELTLPAPARSEVKVFWSGPRVVATASPLGAGGAARAWSVGPDGSSLTAQLPIDPEAAARSLQQSLASSADAAGIKDADFWCASCGLAELPRRSRE